MKYCADTGQEENVEAMLDFLYVSLTEQKIKKNTWEHRLASVKKYLTVVHDVDFIKELNAKKEIAIMRRMYQDEEYKDLTQIKGKSAINKEELLELIRKLPTREKAICLVNLITANRPNEMVRIRIKDFDLDNNSLSVFLKKQKKWHNKRLTQEAAKAVKDYIAEYKLTPDDYFVGRVLKNGKYKSVQVSESGYRYMLNKWTGLTGYNFRKTQVVSMHEAGADLPTIAKQTGHNSLETLSEHYLDVTDPTIDKYL